MFIHLNCHSAFSIKDGVIQADNLIERAGELNMPALGVCDFSNLFNIVSFYTKARAAGIKPIIGVDMLLQEGGQMSLLATDNQGYKNLLYIISAAYTEHRHSDTPLVPISLLRQRHEGLICLCGGADGVVSHALKYKEERRILETFGEIFDDRFYLEIRRNGCSQEEQYLNKAVSIAVEYQYPLVASQGVRFLHEDDYEAHEARICIQTGDVLSNQQRKRLYQQQQYFTSSTQMQEQFADLPSAIDNSQAIAMLCNVEIEIGKSYLPRYIVAEDKTEDEVLRDLAQEKLAAYIETANIEDAPKYRQRLEVELKTICSMGFAGYFLIVMDFICWARSQDIPVGPGRGSGAGSLVAFMLDITRADPIYYGLLFERFLNPERVSLPDFDIDFCENRRDEVIAYVTERYGKDKVAQIITFNTMAARAAVRDVSRVQGKPYAVGDRLANLIDATPNMTLEKAFEISSDLRQHLKVDEEAQEVWEMALKLEGTPRNVGTHAGGVVIAPSPLYDFSPLYQVDNGKPMPHFGKDDIEKVGLVKFDFLGVASLTILHNAIKMARQRHKVDIDSDIDNLEDAKVYKMIALGGTKGIFQLESQAMQALIKRAKPDKFEDIVALTALIRPGPMESGMTDNYVKRKRGDQEVAYPDENFQHELLKPILQSTYGVVVYQEQVMQIAQALSGYSLGGADILRSAMGKKNVEAMEKQRSTFIDGARANGIDATLAKNLFDIIETFAGYGFNRSHSVCYSLITYQGAYLKTYYPAEFFASSLTTKCHDAERVVEMIDDSMKFGVKVLSPDINRSLYEFSVISDTEIAYGLGAIRNLGKATIENIIASREAGNFESIYDFVKRCSINKGSMVALIYAGAFDRVEPQADIVQTRSHHLACYEESIKHALQYHANSQQGSLMGMNVYQEAPPVIEDYPIIESMDLAMAERKFSGIFHSLHLCKLMEREIKDVRASSLKSALKLQVKEVKRFVAFASQIKKKNTSRGTMVIVGLEDGDTKIEAIFYDNNETSWADIQDKIICVQLKRRRSYGDNRGGGFSIEAAESLTEYRYKRLEKIIIFQPPANIKSILAPHIGGSIKILFMVQCEGKMVEMDIGKEWNIRINDELVQQLRQYKIEYKYRS